MNIVTGFWYYHIPITTLSKNIRNAQEPIQYYNTITTSNATPALITQSERIIHTQIDKLSRFSYLNYKQQQHLFVPILYFELQNKPQHEAE